MAADAQCFTPLARLELIRQRNLFRQEESILDALTLGIHPATAEAAWAAARQLDRLCPALENEQDARDYLWRVWHLMVDAARSPDVSDEVHIRLVSILEHLQQCAKGELKAWGVSLVNPVPAPKCSLLIMRVCSTRDASGETCLPFSLDLRLCTTVC